MTAFAKALLEQHYDVHHRQQVVHLLQILGDVMTRALAWVPLAEAEPDQGIDAHI